MSHIVITSSGTTGDFLPYLALAKGLKTRGHSVCLAVNPTAQHLCEKAGVDFSKCGEPLGPDEVRESPAAFDAWSTPTTEGLPDDRDCAGLTSVGMTNRIRQLVLACRERDFLIASSTQVTAYLAQEITGIPWLLTSLPLMPTQEDGTGDATRVFFGGWFENHNVVRESVGLRPYPSDKWPEYVGSDHLLLAYSRYFDEVPAVKYPCTRQTGFWFYDDQKDLRWEPPDELRAFVESDLAPLVFSLGSMPVKEPAREVAVHAEAAALLGRKLVIQKGWADFSAADLPDTVDPRMVHFADYVPHDWLFARAAALIHHGGIGTTARALRHNLPMLVEPRAFDQFTNARRVLALGVGAAAHPHKLTPEGLCRLLDEKVLIPEARRNAEALGAKIRAEDSVRLACDLIERRLQGQPWD